MGERASCAWETPKVMPMTKSKKEHGALWDVRWGEGLESSFKGSYGQKEVGIWLEKRRGSYQMTLIRRVMGSDLYYRKTTVPVP